jgi:hypothetical protein
MLNHPQAEHNVKLLLVEWRVHDIGLREPVRSLHGEIESIRVHRRTEIDRCYQRPSA